MFLDLNSRYGKNLCRGGAVSAALLLAACAQTAPKPVGIEPAATPTVVPVKPAEPAAPKQGRLVEGKGYQFEWALGDNKVISIPKTIRDQATALCRADDFERAYMAIVEFNETRVTGFFNCRGDGGS